MGTVPLDTAVSLLSADLDTSAEHLHMSQDGVPELNILLVGSIDGRHILKTLCQAHRWPRRKINVCYSLTPFPQFLFCLELSLAAWALKVEKHLIQLGLKESCTKRGIQKTVSEEGFHGKALRQRVTNAALCDLPSSRGSDSAEPARRASFFEYRFMLRRREHQMWGKEAWEQAGGGEHQCLDRRYQRSGDSWLQGTLLEERDFYVLENNLEVLGRQLLFLSLALEPLEKMGLQEKSETFLELMGNTLLRSQTAAYLQEKAGLFIRYVTDPCTQQADLPALDLSALKFKERDQLEAIFRFWKNPDPRAFQMEQLWDLRLRQYLGVRYDARRGVCDWDLTMKLHEHGAKVINFREFFRWRNTGVAFEMREASYDVPNKTLASGRLLRHKGEPMPARGYWGDIATGPFITFGIETEETSLLKTVNGLPSKGAQEISLYNVTALFYELSYRSRYDPPTAPDKEGEEGRLQGEEDQATLDVANSQGPPDTEDIRVHFLPLNCLPRLHQKGRYQKLFNLIFFSCSMVHLLKPELCLVSAPKATLIIELT
ncbi:UNVERIFIED_CONTAM: hypothetical protein K2H54_038670, partial [Gekko kuhli]